MTLLPICDEYSRHSRHSARSFTGSLHKRNTNHCLPGHKAMNASQKRVAGRSVLICIRSQHSTGSDDRNTSLIGSVLGVSRKVHDVFPAADIGPRNRSITQALGMGEAIYCLSGHAACGGLTVEPWRRSVYRFRPLGGVARKRIDCSA